MGHHSLVRWALVLLFCCNGQMLAETATASPDTHSLLVPAASTSGALFSVTSNGAPGTVEGKIWLNGTSKLSGQTFSTTGGLT